MAAAILVQSFFLKDTKKVARDLLGKTLCLKKPRGRGLSRFKIVETEAYLGLEDPACHSFHAKRTERVRSLYLPGGHAYVYLIYGIYNCLNVVTGDETHPEAILIRAIEPLDGNLVEARTSDLKTNGPGKLCRYLGITRAKHDGIALWKKESGLWIEEGERLKASQIVVTKRIGVQNYPGGAADWPLRFHVRANPYVSKT
ncbi:MAG: DNA-3-methyladenine glycosylase [Bdellovibrionota bacterium]